MKKYIIVCVLFLSISGILYGLKQSEKNRDLTDIMLLNIECLATPENSPVECYYSGTIDCPVHNKPVLYYW